MYEIYNLISDGEMQDEISEGFRNRDIEQKFLYQGNGAVLYYDDKKQDFIYGNKDYFEQLLKFGNNNVFEKRTNNVLISLGCGNSIIEKFLYEKLDKDINLDYFGIDISRTMLELSIKNMIELDIGKHFVCADFSKKNFRLELIELTKQYNKRIFTFFSNTIGNINHTNIIDILYNILNKGEQIWIDIRLRSGKSAKDDLKEFENYFKYLTIKQKREFYSNILKRYKIPVKNGEFALNTVKESYLNAIKYQFKYFFKKKTTLNVKGEDITILPGESINLLQVYSYDPNGIINFFKEHNFKLINKAKFHQIGQFLFEKI